MTLSAQTKTTEFLGKDLRATNDDSRREVEDLVPFRLTRLSETIGRGATDHFGAEFGISISELRVLAILGNGDPISANEISQRTRIDKGWISRSISKLMAKGYIARRRDARDNRRLILDLTDEGRGLYGRIVPSARARHDRFLDALSTEEKAHLDHILSKLQIEADRLIDEK